jgi:hypothetical protein
LDKRGKQFVALLRMRKKSKKAAASAEAADSKSQEEHLTICVSRGPVYSWVIIAATRRINGVSHLF